MSSAPPITKQPLREDERALLQSQIQTLEDSGRVLRHDGMMLVWISLAFVLISLVIGFRSPVREFAWALWLLLGAFGGWSAVRSARRSRERNASRLALLRAQMESNVVQVRTFAVHAAVWILASESFAVLSVSEHTLLIIPAELCYSLLTFQEFPPTRCASEVSFRRLPMLGRMEMVADGETIACERELQLDDDQVEAWFQDRELPAIIRGSMRTLAQDVVQWADPTPVFPSDVDINDAV